MQQLTGISTKLRRNVAGLLVICGKAGIRYLLDISETGINVRIGDLD